MPSISLTDLVEVVARSGTSKAKKVASIKHRAPYQPASDFYKALREGIARIHQRDGGRDALRELAQQLTDAKKRTNYPGAIAGYHKWWGHRTLTWFGPPRNLHTHADISVTINPELGLVIDGERIVVKLYLKADPIGKVRTDLVTALMEHALRPVLAADEKVALLDVRGGKLFRPGTDVGPVTAMANAELAYIAALWPHI